MGSTAQHAAAIGPQWLPRSMQASADGGGVCRQTICVSSHRYGMVHAISSATASPARRCGSSRYNPSLQTGRCFGQHLQSKRHVIDPMCSVGPRPCTASFRAMWSQVLIQDRCDVGMALVCELFCHVAGPWFSACMSAAAFLERDGKRIVLYVHCL